MEGLYQEEPGTAGACPVHGNAGLASSSSLDPTLTRLNNFRMRLLVGCDGLEQNAARFRYRNTGTAPSDPLCKLDQEDAVHFTAVCSRLCPTHCVLPNCCENPVKFTEIVHVLDRGLRLPTLLYLLSLCAEITSH